MTGLRCMKVNSEKHGHMLFSQTLKEIAKKKKNI